MHQAVELLAAAGYTDDLRVEASGVRCGACGLSHQADRVVVTHTFRFEGPTDPADEAIVLGIECPACGHRGIIVSAYGPDADPEVFAALQRLVR